MILLYPTNCIYSEPLLYDRRVNTTPCYYTYYFTARQNLHTFSYKKHPVNATNDHFFNSQRAYLFCF